MARLNEPQSATADALENQKRKWLRQNKELARANSQQNQRIRTLEQETTMLLTENISLREKVIRLETEIDRREHTERIVKSVHAAHRDLQQKMEEMHLIVGQLGKAVEPPEPKQQPQCKSNESTPVLESRLMRPSYNPAEIMDGILPSIQEDVFSRRSSLNNQPGERRRSSFGLEEILLPPPEAEDEKEDPESDPQKTPPRSLIDTRPRRRDSSRPQDLQTERQSVFVPNPTASITISKPPKRKFGEKETEIAPVSPSDVEFRFSRVAERARQASQESLKVEVGETDKENEDVVMSGTEPEPQREPQREPLMMQKQRPESEKPAREKQTHSRRTSLPAPGTGSVPALPTSTRKALGPKSTNSDPMNSPLKKATAGADFIKPEISKIFLDKPLVTELSKPNHPPPSTRNYRAGVAKRDTDVPPPDLAAEGPRPSRSSRARSAVSYAEPSLRAKMRREEKGFVDAVTGEGRNRSKSKSSLRGGSMSFDYGETADGDARVKPEPTGEGDDDNVRWLNLPAVRPREPERERESEKKEGCTGSNDEIQQLLQQHRRRSSNSGITALLEARRERAAAAAAAPLSTEDVASAAPPSLLPASIITHRGNNRRSSASVFFMPSSPPPPTADDARTKIDIFESAAPNGDENEPAEERMRSGSTSSSTRRVTVPTGGSGRERERAAEREKAVGRVKSSNTLAEEARRSAARRKSMML